MAWKDKEAEKAYYKNLILFNNAINWIKKHE